MSLHALLSLVFLCLCVFVCMVCKDANKTLCLPVRKPLILLQNLPLFEYPPALSR